MVLQLKREIKKKQANCVRLLNFTQLFASGSTY